MSKPIQSQPMSSALRDKKKIKSTSVVWTIVIIAVIIVVTFGLSELYLHCIPSGFIVKTYQLNPHSSQEEIYRAILSPLAIIALAIYQFLEIPENVYNIYQSVSGQTKWYQAILPILRLVLNALLVLVSILLWHFTKNPSVPFDVFTAN